VTLFSTVDYRSTTRTTIAFVSLSAIGFLVCCFTGAETMLGWMPRTWRLADGDGGTVPLNSWLAGAFALFGGGALARALDRGTHDAFFRRELSEERKQLLDLVETSLHEQGLTSMRERLSQRVVDLQAECERRHGIDDVERPRHHLTPEGMALARCEDMLALVERQQARLRDMRHRAEKRDQLDRQRDRDDQQLRDAEERRRREREAAEAWELTYLRKNPGSKVVVTGGEESPNGSYLATRVLLSPEGVVVRSFQFGSLFD
jgi:hypothetical protein